MALVLKDWVVDLVFVAVDVLCPVFGVLASIYPAFVVLGLYDEDAIYGYYQVIYLRAAFWCRDGDVVQHSVLVFWKVVKLSCDNLFANLSPNLSPPEDKDEQPDDKQYREYGK